MMGQIVYEDLIETLETARRSVLSTRSIWCTSSTAFETRISRRRGLILGGAWSPQFIPESEKPWYVPFTRVLERPYIFASEITTGTMDDWLSAATEVSRTGSLLLVTNSIGEDLLRFFVTNALTGSLRMCVVQSGYRPTAELPFVYGRANSGPPESALKLPVVLEAWVRKRATVVFPSPSSNWASDAEEICVIEIGGEDQADQQARIRFFADTLRQEDEKAA